MPMSILKYQKKKRRVLEITGQSKMKTINNVPRMKLYVLVTEMSMLSH